MKTQQSNFERREFRTVDDLVERELQLSRQQKAAREDLVRAEESAGEAYMTGADSADALKAVALLQAGLGAMGRALDAVRKRRGELILAEFKSEANVIRERIARKKQEFDAIGGKTWKLLKSLSAIEGIEFDHTILRSMPGAAPGTFRMPRSFTIGSEIAKLEEKAADIEASGVPESGSVDLEATTSEEIIRAVLSHRSAGPDVATVVAWLDAVERAARSRNVEFGSHSRRAVVSWTGNQISDASYIFCAAFARANNERSSVSDLAHMWKPGIDVESATFKAPQVEPAVRPLIAAA